MSDLAIPNSDSLRTTELVPAAKPTPRGYAIPTGLQIPDAPTDKGLTQLGKGLQVLNPSLTAVADEIVTEQEKREQAEAFALVRQRQLKNVEDLKQAQAEGKIPMGASPNFIRALHTNVLAIKGTGIFFLVTYLKLLWAIPLLAFTAHRAHGRRKRTHNLTGPPPPYSAALHSQTNRSRCA